MFAPALPLDLTAMLPATSMSSGAAVAVCFAPEENCIAFAVDAIDRARARSSRTPTP